MNRFLKACALGFTAALIGLVSFSAQATPAGYTTFLFTGNCIDCAVKAGTDSYAVTATLVMQGEDVQLGQKKTAPYDFFSFSYGGSNLMDPYEITSQDMMVITSIIGQNTTIQEDLGDGTFLFFTYRDATCSSVDADNNCNLNYNGPWSTGIGDYVADYGDAGTWQLVSENNVPEPATALLLGMALVGLGLTRCRHS